MVDDKVRTFALSRANVDGPVESRAVPMRGSPHRIILSTAMRSREGQRSRLSGEGKPSLYALPKPSPIDGQPEFLD
jgi:hypothetical protein